MRIHDTFFFGSFFFLLGILLASIGWKQQLLTLTIFLAITIFLIGFITKKIRPNSCPFVSLACIRILASLTLLILAGAIFYTSRELAFKTNQNIKFNKEIAFTGKVQNNPLQKTYQEFIFELKEPLAGNIQIRAANYPAFQYGEVLTLKGKIQKTKGNYGDYLERNKKVSGISYYPELQERGEEAGRISKILLGIREHILSAFKETLPYTESAFLGGITVGSREEFTDEFKNAMSKSGTTHLVALSGYNITILVNIIAGTLVFVLSRRKALFGTILAVIAFVIMAGAEASVVRAAIMGIIAAIAPFVGRLYAPRNAIAAAALGMTLWNPNVLVYDVGFQLSFLALIGIIYLKPALKTLFKIQNKGFLNWKENLTTTASAQLMVTPLLITTFGSVSATSLLSNLLILELIPFTMFLGFVLAGAHLISAHVSTIIAWITLVPLKAELGIIHVFGVFTVPIAPSFTAVAIAIYYLVLTVFIYRFTKFR